tara:strand:+ start:155 stop:565 length:411 start_codon:yes stop_codon:yes gene_type:complete
MDYTRLSKQLLYHEGIRLKPYRCSADKLTIGIGRNIEDVGITEEEAFYLLNNDIKKVVEQCQRNFEWFDGLNDLRKEAIVNLVFNMGFGKFLQFKKTIKHIENEEFELAGAELLDSRYAQQVGQRAIDVANQLADK